ncbi:MAG: TauD/TfdA family dioxygenase [Hyphomicrobiaceae bacterium]
MTIHVKPISSAIGAVIEGVDLAQPLDNETFNTLYDAFNRHSVLLLRNQSMSPEQHVAFSRRFGELEQHVLKSDLLPGLPEVYVLSNKGFGRAKAGWFWHTDLSYQKIPSKASFLHGLEIPSMGGDTMFASTAAAYDALSDKMKAFLDTLTAEHDFRQGYEKYSKRWAAPIPEEAFKARPPVIHPVVRTHPETGRKSLYVNEGYTTRIMELSHEESEALLNFLFRHSTRAEFVYRHHWSARDLVMWDNRATIHQALSDYNEPRYMHRTTISGDIVE